MLSIRIAALAAVTGALVLGPVSAASAHVHGITPLRCTPAPENAGANQTDSTPAHEKAGLTGVIPITKGGNVVLFGEGFNAAVCNP